MNYNVFVDFHHASLLNSFILLFEKRFNGNVFRPIGMDWAEEGFWKVYDHPATQAQYLGIGSATPDGTLPLNTVLEHISLSRTEAALQPLEGLYYCQDIDSGYYNKAITLTAFFQLPIDIVIATLPQHIEPFKKLCELHPNKPKFIYQIGNAWDVPDSSLVKNVMASAIVPHVPEGVHFISYHQEFDLKQFNPFIDIYGNPDYWVGYSNYISSFVNVFQDFPDYQLFLAVEKLMTEYQFRSFGGQCRDGAAHGSNELGSRMKESQFIWHTKAGGDGYGHVLYNSAAVGRPLIIKTAYYKGKLGEELLRDGETCLAIDNLTVGEIVDKVRKYREPEAYRQLCENVYNNFCAKVQFDHEAEKLRVFLENLK
jgi:hypothetical protein